MPSELAPEETPETLEQIANRQEMEAIQTREAAARIKLNKQAQTEFRKNERRQFLQPAMSFADMYRQSDARVYFMKAHHFEYTKPGTATWDHPKIANKLLSRFKHNRKIVAEKEIYLEAAIRLGNEDMIKQYRSEADVALAKCLHAHYGIGVLYTEFIRGVAPVT